MYHKLLSVPANTNLSFSTGSARGRELRAAAALSRFEIKQEDDTLVTDSEVESDADENILIKRQTFEAVDINGNRLVDGKGRGMVKVCEDEDKDDEDAKEELSELQNLGTSYRKPLSQAFQSRPESTKDCVKADCPTIHETDMNTHCGSCPMCSLTNESTALTCGACMNVLRPDAVPNSWRCNSSICTGSVYINSGDVGLCGVCGARNCPLDSA